MKRLKATPFLSLFGVLFCLLTYTAPLHAATVYGWIENIKINHANTLVKAKLDTGAKSSSLDARELVEFTRKEKPWVRFDLVDEKGKIFSFEKPVIRYVKIKLKSHIHRQGRVLETAKRPVVKLLICLNGQYKTIHVNLTSRQHFIYPMLLGRAALIKFEATVNPSKTFLATEHCRKK